MHQAQDSDTLSQSHNRHTTYGSNEESPSNSSGSPAMQAPLADEWAKMAALNERGSEQLPYEFSSTSLAHLKRAEVGRGMLMDGVALEQAPRVPTTEEQSGGLALLPAQDARSTPSSGCTSRRSASASNHGVKQSREHLFKSCMK